MAVSPDFLEFLKDQLRSLGSITARRMFSGAALYCDGIVFALILRDTLHFKVDDANRCAYEAEGRKPFTYEAQGKTRQVGAYWQVPERLLDEPDELIEWAGHALAAGRRAAARKKPRTKANPVRT